MLIDTQRYEVRIGGKQVRLTPREWQLLSLLTEKPGVMVRNERIYAEFFGPEWESIDSRSISQHLARLRQKIGHERIKTEPMVGLKFAGKVRKA